MARSTLTISSKNYSSFSLRGWLLCKLAGLDVEEELVDLDHHETRQELLLLSPSFKVPRLKHEGVEVYSILSIAEFLNESFPKAGMWPKDRAQRAHCRSVSGEMHSGFYSMRSALPMNIRAEYKAFKVFTGARPDIERIKEVWTECLKAYGGPFLFGAKPSVADAMYAPVCSRFRTYSIELEPELQAYCDHIFGWAPMKDWVEQAHKEPEEMIELEVEF